MMKIPVQIDVDHNKIVNLGAGTNPDDAINLGQLTALYTGLTNPYLPKWSGTSLVDSGISDDGTTINVDLARAWYHNTTQDVTFGDRLMTHCGVWLEISDSNQHAVLNASGSAIWIGDWMGSGNQTLIGIDDSGSTFFISAANISIAGFSTGLLYNDSGTQLVSVQSIAAGGLTFLATPTSANLKSFVTNEVGTGNLLFNTGITAISFADINTPAFNWNLQFQSATTMTADRNLKFDLRNASRTVIMQGNLTILGNFAVAGGAFDLTLTLSANTNVTLPTTGTLATHAGAETLTNKTIQGGTHTSVTSFSLRDTSAAFDVTITSTSSVTLAAGRTLTLDMVNADRTIKLSGNLTLNAALTISNSLTLAGTNGTTMTFPGASATVAGLGITQTFTGVNTFTPSLRTTPTVPYFTITTPADTAIGSTSESIGLDFTAATRTWAASGTVTLQRERYFRAPTYAGSSTIITKAVNLYVEDPVQGSGTTISTAAGTVSAFAIQAPSVAFGHLTNCIKIIPWSAQSTSWIDMPTGGGACGIGSGGPGSDAWLGFCSGAGNWFGNSGVGDIAIRATSTGLLLGNSSSTYTMKIQSDQITIRDNGNFIFNTSAGTKIATSTSQKFGFWNATPIVQPTTAVAAATFVASTGTAVNDASTFDGYTLKQLVKALRNVGLLA